MADIQNPHDKFFKATFQDLDTTKDFLINDLPKEMLDLVDVDELSLEAGSYIDENLRESSSDLLVKTKNLKNKKESRETSNFAFTWK